MANKVVVKGLKLSDQGEWISKDKLGHGEVEGKPLIWYKGVRYYTHLWLAKKFVPNPKKFFFVEIINQKKPLTAENVRWIRSHKNKIDQRDADNIRKEWQKGKKTMTEIGKDYGLCVSSISRIIKGVRWN